ncbi:MAG: HIT family protein [Betaproteobacteria bacterium]|nr:HIT family protein [Betaproteobacteria bacterium]MDH3435818.1 HIT family protein [Betaproteobacteria bacterium]
MSCELCDHAGGELLWRDPSCRVVHVDEPGYRGFCRVIWTAHVKEMTDLPEDARAHLMRVVFAVEAVLREMLHPHKLNLASLGNVTPHVHWHVIPRFSDDPHFPNPIWGARLRAPVAASGAQPVADLRIALAQRLG